MTPAEVEHCIGQLYRLNDWLIAFPLTDEFRGTTTFRQFYELIRAKEADLGLTPQVRAALDKVQDNPDLDMAVMEIEMTMDSRELLHGTGQEDLPLSSALTPE